MKIGALETGGTKMVCAVGDEQGNVLDRTVFPTKNPEDTIPQLVSYFKNYEEHKVEALGIGCFGPLNLERKSESFGMIMHTPKLAWQNYPILSVMEEALQIPVALDTDVNAAALGEATWGAGKEEDVVLYITIGTGVGVGVSIHGQLLHGLLHPEAGHILLVKRRDDPYEGACPFHTNCLEGLASGPAIMGRWGDKAENLVDNEYVWEMESDYIAQAIANYILTYSPNRIILGGGVMHQERLYPMIREKTKAYLHGYVVHPILEEHMDEYIVAPGLGDNSGIKGAFKLALNHTAASRMQ